MLVLFNCHLLTLVLYRLSCASISFATTSSTRPDKQIGNWYVFDMKIWKVFGMQFDRYIGQIPIKNLHISRSKFLIGEYGGFWSEFDQYTNRTRIKFFDRILTSKLINKISNVWSGRHFFLGLLTRLRPCSWPWHICTYGVLYPSQLWKNVHQTFFPFFSISPFQWKNWLTSCQQNNCEAWHWTKEHSWETT
jgi:hypothetical protein